jgi:hypothetical protein
VLGIEHWQAGCQRQAEATRANARSPHQNKQVSKFTKADVPEEWKPHSIAHLAGLLSGKQDLD